MAKTIRSVPAPLTALLLAWACAGTDSPGPGPNPNPTVATVAVTPATFNLVTGDTLRFAAAAFAAGGAPMQATFAWGSSGGTVTGTGLFTAGNVAGAAKVWATAGTVADTADGNVTTITPPPTAVDTVFADGFESGTLALWDEVGRSANQAVVTTRSHFGTRSLQVTFPIGSDGGWTTKFFMPGYDSLYVSYWVYFQAGWQSGTKLLALYGSRTDDQYSATGKAGVCPNGTDFFSLDVVEERNGNPGPTHFYSYYPGMAQSPPGSGTCYGVDGSAVGALYTPPLEITEGTWHHVEYWVVLNTPGQSNLHQRFCLDGVLRGTWSGISARSSNILMLNAVTLSHSIATGSPQTQQMWADDVLVTRQRPAGAC